MLVRGRVRRCRTGPGLGSGKGLCCSFADGFKIENVDWDAAGGSCEPGRGGSGMPSVPMIQLGQTALRCRNLGTPRFDRC